jgi:hypothetical protein
MKKIPKKMFDAMVTGSRKYWETGNTDHLGRNYALCQRLQEETGVEWICFSDLVGSIVMNRGFKPDVSNEVIYEVLKVLGYEVVNDGKEHSTE